MDKKKVKKNESSDEDNKDVELSEDVKKEMNTKKVIVDKATGKTKEVDVYDRENKK